MPETWQERLAREEAEDRMKLCEGCGPGNHHWECLTIYDAMEPQWRCTNADCPRNKPLKNIPEDIVRQYGTVDEDSIQSASFKSLGEDIAEAFRDAGIKIKLAK